MNTPARPLTDREDALEARLELTRVQLELEATRRALEAERANAQHWERQVANTERVAGERVAKAERDEARVAEAPPVRPRRERDPFPEEYEACEGCGNPVPPVELAPSCRACRMVRA